MSSCHPHGIIELRLLMDFQYTHHVLHVLFTSIPVFHEFPAQFKDEPQGLWSYFYAENRPQGR